MLEEVETLLTGKCSFEGLATSSVFATTKVDGAHWDTELPARAAATVREA
jgi:hypothetical protein